MREIIYEETRQGLMEPRATPAQKRRQREAERRVREARRKRAEIVLGILVAAALIAAVIGYLALWDWAFSHHG